MARQHGRLPLSWAGDGFSSPAEGVRRVSISEAVPPGRLRCELTGPRMLLRTVQTVEAVQQLCDHGTLTPDPARAESSFTAAYRWMLLEMDRRLPTSGAGMLWFWARIRRADLIADLRVGEVLLTCRVPRERVLLSHFGEWHMVLNDALSIPPKRTEDPEVYLQRAEREWDEFDAELHDADVYGLPVHRWSPKLRRKLQGSWASIFDTDLWSRHDAWQATTHSLHATEVVDAVELIAE